MGLKILHSADWHMDSPFAGFAPEKQEYLKQELKKIPGKIADLCRRENCDLVLLSGDIFDSITGWESADIVRNALRDCGVPVFIAPGNHDYLTSSSPWLAISWPENVYIFTVGMQSVSMPKLDCRIYGAGYRGMDCKPLMENFKAEGPERSKIAVLHGDPMRLRSPYCPVTTAQVRDSGLDYVALGHIHKCGSFRAKQSLCGWPGAPMGRGFDETREKGVYIVDSYGKAIESVTGTGRQPSRELFADYLAEYLGTNVQANYVVSQVNGKLAILGLEAGTYYLKETTAPDGYNLLAAAQEATGTQPAVCGSCLSDLSIILKYSF